MNINDAQWYHSKKRCKERYRVNLQRHEYRWMSNQIKDKTTKAKFIRQTTPRKSLWLVSINPGVCFLVAYDEALENIATFLPLDYLDNKFKLLED